LTAVPAAQILLQSYEAFARCNIFIDDFCQLLDEKTGPVVWGRSFHLN
jgi:hypothetical protein